MVKNVKNNISKRKYIFFVELTYRGEYPISDRGYRSTGFGKGLSGKRREGGESNVERAEDFKN